MDQQYLDFLRTVQSTIQAQRTAAMRAVFHSLVLLYWEVGKLIVEKQAEHGWGAGVIKQLAADLKKEFPSRKGLSARNLEYMRRFYLTYKDFINAQQLVAQIPWGHNMLLLDSVKTAAAREFYLKTAAQQGWSRNILQLQIKNQAYERSRLEPKQHNFDQTLPEQQAKQAEDAMKSSYNLEFLGLAKKVSELELEGKMIERIRDFILELGYGFTYIGHQYKLQLGEQLYWTDLLFYHRKLRCLVAFELKAGRFKPEYAGKLNFYLNILDDTVRLPEENPSIGIILCTKQDELAVEYSLKSIKHPMGVAQYQLYQELPEELAKQLPSLEELRQPLEEE
ncbi:MAG: PDDEXK nuclease domain-containing protein [Bacteroidota bacterium]